VEVGEGREFKTRQMGSMEQKRPERIRQCDN